MGAMRGWWFALWQGVVAVSWLCRCSVPLRRPPVPHVSGGTTISRHNLRPSQKFPTAATETEEEVITSNPNPFCHPHQPWPRSLHGAQAPPPPPFWSVPLPSRSTHPPATTNADAHLQGRAGLVAWRRSRGGVGAMGKAFYKGGFEPKMNKKEASLILSLK